MKLLCVLLCVIGGMLLPSANVFAKEEVRLPHWRWVHPNLPLWGHFETADEARQLWNQDQEEKYAACAARACGNCAKTIVGPVTKPSLGITAKVNGQFTSVTNAEAVGTTFSSACNGNPPRGPTSAPSNHTIGISSQRYCPAGFSARNISTPPGYEVIDGVQVVSYASECFKEIPDPPQCSKVPQTDTRCGNPIDAMTGSKIAAETDYASADGLLRVTRSYSSALGGWSWGRGATLLDLTGRGTTRPPGTDLVSNLKLVPVGIRDAQVPTVDTPVSFPLVKPAASGPMVWLIAADGRRTAFTETATNTFSTPSLDKSQLSIVSAGGTHEWRVKSPAGSLRIFNAAGRLSREVFADGKSIGYSYAGEAVTVTAVPGGRQVVYSRSNNDVPAGKHDVVTLPDGTELTYTFDAAGMVTTATYADGRSKTYLYNEPAHAPPPSTGGNWVRLTGLLDESNVRLGTYTYNAEAPISTELAGGANRFALTYFNGRTEFTRPPLNATEIVRWDVGPDGERRVISRQQPATISGSATGTSIITYDAGGYVASVLDYNGYRTCYSNDQSRGLETIRVEGLAVGVGCPSNLAAHTIPANTRQRKVSTQWHPAWNFLAAIAQPRKITRWVYNGQPDPTTGTTASCAPLTALLPDGSPIAVVCKKIEQATTDATGTASFGATATGAPRSWSYTYNSFGQVLTADGPRDDVSDVTTYAYYECDTGNECGQLAGITNSLGHVTSYDAYNAHGQPLTITNPNNVVTTLTYDLRQRLKSRTVGSELTTFDYWPTGLLKKATLPDGSYLDYVYDAAHRLTDINDSDGNRIHYSLDNAGNRTAEEFFDPSSSTASQKRARAYDELSRLYREIGAAGGDAVTTFYQYDKNGNQTNIFAPLDRDTAQVYDELNRLTQVTDPLNGVTNYGYNALDQLISVTDPKRLITSYDYDGLGDLKQQTSPDTGVTANTYDSSGNLKTSTDARGAVATYTYDELNRVATASFAVGSTVDQSLTYSYDEGAYGLGRLTGVSDADHSLAWSYDEQGRVLAATQVVGSISKTTSYSYLNGLRQSLTTPSGQVITYGYANGKITSISVNGAVLVSAVLYEPFGPVRQWTWGNGTLSVRTFDEDGKVKTIDSAGLKTYGYDDAFRITGITDASDPSLSWAYGYDTLDHLTSASKTGTTFGYQYDANGNRHTQTGTGAASFTIATSSNRLTSTSGALTRTYVYDNAGNSTSFGGITFTYNNRGRMKSSTKNGVTTNYTYNALGQLIKRGASALYYYDDDGHVLGIYSSTGALTEEIVWLGDLPLATLRPNAGGGIDAYYIHSDHLNTPRLITDEGNTVRWKWDVEPFGAGSPNEDPAGAGAFIFNLRFPGQVYFAETGLHYNYFRDYDPSTGRYVQSDPMGLAGGLNTYGYANANPLAYVDPLGLVGIPDYTKIADWINPKPLSEEECRQLRDQIYRKNELLRDELSRYDPILDGMGGWPMSYASGFTKPGGHYKEIRDLQKGLKKDVKRYNQRCRCDSNNDGNPPITSNVDELANSSVEPPVYPVFFIPIDGLGGGFRPTVPVRVPALAIP